MVDPAGVLHIVHWSAGQHVTHIAFSYVAATNTLSSVAGPTQLDAAGSANHPALAVSPLDGTLTVAWVSQATATPAILARSRSAAGLWGAVEQVSTPSTKVWTSPFFGVNIDQGPSLVIGPDGTRHLAYIEDYDTTGQYGHIHYASRPSGSTAWTDTPVPSTYSHDPALAMTGGGQLYMLGHGHAKNAACTSSDDMCLKARNADGTWGASTLLLAHSPTWPTFDSSVSVKWSVVGFNRPNTVEFLTFAPIGGNYNTTALFYGRAN
jgi:hypothetical protein